MSPSTPDNVREKPRFLTIPLEIRLRVYEIIAKHEDKISMLENSGFDSEDSEVTRKTAFEGSKNGWLGTLLLCRQVHSEAEIHLYRNSCFAVNIDIDLTKSFFDSLSKRARESIMRISIMTYRDRSDAYDPDPEAWGPICSYLKCNLPGVRDLDIEIRYFVDLYEDPTAPEWVQSVSELKNLHHLRLSVTGLLSFEVRNEMSQPRIRAETLFKYLSQKMVNPAYGSTRLESQSLEYYKTEYGLTDIHIIYTNCAKNAKTAITFEDILKERPSEHR